MAHADDLTIRRARPADLDALGRLGAALARAHHRWDPKRFFVVPRMHEGYAWWLGRELKNRKAVVLVAERRGRRLGEALREAFVEKGAPRVILLAASKNEVAQRFFAAMGFRPTVVEMALELPRRRRAR